MSLSVDHQIQRQINEFLPKKLKFVKTETINPMAKKVVSIDNKVDVDYDDVEGLMKWKLEGCRNAGRGYYNAHSNCYIISILQVLTHTAPFYNYITQQKINIENVFFKALSDLMHEAFQKKNNYLKPTVFERNLKKLSNSLERFEQEDATEFYLLLLDHIHEAIIGKGKNKVSAIGSIFHTDLICRITCYNCVSFNDHEEHFSVLPIEITNKRTVESGLDQFFKKEMISEYRCEKCNTKTTASKSYHFKRLPWILALQLKRFTWDDKKINGKVKFPLQLNASKYGVDGMFDLYAIVVHIGRSKHGGHYVAYCKSPSGGWFCMDDESVQPVPVKKVLEQEAYMLFYSKSEERVLVKKEENKKEEDSLKLLSEIVKKENEQNQIETSVQQKEEIVFNSQSYKSSRVISVQQLLEGIDIRPIKRKPEEGEIIEMKKVTVEEFNEIKANVQGSPKKENVPTLTIRKKEDKVIKKVDVTGKVVKERKDIETFDLRSIPIGLNYSERVLGWDEETEEIRKNVLRTKVGEIDKEKQSKISKLDHYDVELDKPKERKLRRNMKNAFKVENIRFNPFQFQSERKHKRKQREEKDGF